VYIFYEKHAGCIGTGFQLREKEYFWTYVKIFVPRISREKTARLENWPSHLKGLGLIVTNLSDVSRDTYGTPESMEDDASDDGDQVEKDHDDTTDKHDVVADDEFYTPDGRYVRSIDRRRTITYRRLRDTIVGQQVSTPVRP